jgi:MFS family permease
MFYGVRIVAVCFLTNFVSVGFLFYSYGVFFKALAADFGGTRLGVAVGLSGMQLATAIVAPLLGRLLDRGHIRSVMCAGAVAMAGGFALASRIEALWQFYLVLVTLLGVGSAMLGGLASSTLVANWYAEWRGTALGLAAVGISLSGVVMAPVATELIAWIGWRDTFLVYGAIALGAVIPAVWLVVVNRPEDLSLRPDGARSDHPIEPLPEPALPLAPGDQLTDHPAHLDWSARGAMRDRNFWVIVLAVGLNFCANGAILTHIIPHATDIGFAPRAAAAILSVMAGTGVVGKVLFGAITDRVDMRIAFVVCAGLQLTGTAILLGGTSYSELLWAGGIFGLGMGGLVPVQGAAVGAAFGRRAFGRVMGLMSPAMLPIHMLGVPLAGYLYDVYGSYELAFQIFLVLYAAGALAALMLRLPETEPR